VLRLRLRRAEGEFRAVLASAIALRRDSRYAGQGYVGVSVQLEVLAELLRLKKPEEASKHLDLTRNYVREGWLMRANPSGRCARKTQPRPRCRFACAA